MDDAAKGIFLFPIGNIGFEKLRFLFPTRIDDAAKCIFLFPNGNDAFAKVWFLFPNGDF